MQSGWKRRTLKSWLTSCKIKEKAKCRIYKKDI